MRLRIECVEIAPLQYGINEPRLIIVTRDFNAA